MELALTPSHAVDIIPACAVLVFAAHPDDEIFGCAGAIIRHASALTPISLVVATDGAYGLEGDARQQMLLTRQAESQAAAALVGVRHTEFWRHCDRELAYGETLVQQIIEAIKTCTADLVYAPSLHEIHPDHRALAMAVVEAVRRIGGGIRLALYEVGAPLRPNTLVDITDIRQQKRQAMLCFASQNSLHPYPDLIEALNRYRSYSLPADVIAVEAFELVTPQDIEKNRLEVFVSEYHRRRELGVAALGRQDLPLVSVIIRSMSRPTLDAALDSIARQTYPNIEVLVVNAKGSQHGAVSQSCGRFPVHFVNPMLELRRSQAANQGLAAASGELLIFLDDDDWFLPHHIASLKAELDAAPAVIAAYASVQAIDCNGAEVRRFEESFDPVQLCIDNYIPIHAVLFRRQALLGGARFDETLDICEDWDFWLQVSAQGHFHHHPEVGAVYHLETTQGSGVWGDANRTRSAMLTIYAKWLAQWSDQTRWAIFEYARYKRLFGEQHRVHQQQLAQCNGELAQCAAQLAAAQARHESLMASTSWRVTRPLRWVKQLFAGARTTTH